MVQINARVSEETKKLLEKECQATGVKKEFLVEEALLHHLQALQALPQDVIIRPRVVISPASAEAVVAEMENPQPTEALRDLMRRHGD